MIVLNAKNKLKIVTGEFTKPAVNSETRALWERTNDMIISWILNTITDQINNSLNFVNTACELWRELHEHYSQLDGHRIYQLSNEIAQLKQNQCSIETYYHKLKGYWDEIDAIEAPHMCTCTCRKKSKGSPQSQNQASLSHYLLNLTTPDTQTTITQNGTQIGAMPMLRGKATSRRGYFVENVVLRGHQREECYKLVGYPIGHPLHGKYIPPQKQATQYSSQPKSINVVTTTNDNNNAECAMNARMDQIQNQLNQVLLMMQNNQKGTESNMYNDSTACIHKLIASHISTQKYRFIASLVSHVKNAWIVDSGATDHVSNTLSNMHNIHHCKSPILVTLPNGHNTSITKLGSVTINSNIILHDVFYIPSFSYNLLSDHTKMIAHGILCNGLYVIQQQSDSIIFPPLPLMIQLCGTQDLDIHLFKS
ncbi:uncharacterized protein [Rutidosis leptorrhynchoides]|uniref:uncharacterized protein n=1 Tax=Rutidosis leptorrhynchoides TaxID=125765 RepID=UPI003A996D05